MYACICKAVTVDEVSAAIDAGAQSIEAVGQATAAGTSCTNCHDHLDELLESRCGACPLAALVA
ncbi:MAG TPA: (2Fe-2S)-binding protein [Jatrophihabitantaceae bacterium]|jgi:bacterioferritin-associated ferredoxin